MRSSRLVEQFFRHEYGKLVASLTRRVGAENIEAIEDAAQSALMTALERWKTAGEPDHPSAWLFRVAINNVTSELRAHALRRRLLAQNGAVAPPVDGPEAYLASEVEDDLLRMLFLCCDDALPRDSQLVLALKTLCGFSVREIAHRLFTTDANVYKRLQRARAHLRRAPPRPEDLGPEQYGERLPRVHSVLYVLFTEGFLSVHTEQALRRDLCEEAMRLGYLLAEHPAGRTPAGYALLALMHLHMARFHARQDGAGGLLLLEEQDRRRWDRRGIQRGLEWLARSADGDVYSRYHAEASIAAEHCLAPSFEETRWERVIQAYDLLDQVAPSALHRLNRALAVAEHQDPHAGLAVLEGLEPPTWLAGSYMWVAVMADLHRRAGKLQAAARYRAVAMDLAPTPAIRASIERRLAAGAAPIRADSASGVRTRFEEV